MKIAIIVRSLKYGGMEGAACNQADAFSLAGHKSTLIYFSNKNKAILPKEKKVNVIHIDLNKIMKKSILGVFWNLFAQIINTIFRKTYPLVKGYFTSSIFRREFKNLEEDEKYDLILIRGQGTYEQIWNFKDERSVRIIVNVSKKNHYSFKDKLMSRCYYEGLKLNCNSVGSKEFYIDKFKGEDIIPLSLDSIKNPFFNKKALTLSEEKNPDIPNKPYILGLGRLVKTKNFELLIDSYLELKKNYHIKEILVIVGDGDDKEYLEQKCKLLNLENDVLFMGYQSNPFNWIKNSEIIVFTSKIEGLSNVLIEAMCTRTRIVVSKSPGGMLEMMQGNLQYNIANVDAKDISEKIYNSLKNDKSFYYDDYKKALSQFDPKNVVQQWIDMYINKL